jgi:hypothetical protein
MGRMSDLHIEVQETGDSWQEVMDRAVKKIKEDKEHAYKKRKTTHRTRRTSNDTDI